VVWRLRELEEPKDGALAEVEVSARLPHGAEVSHVSWSMDGTTLATSAGDGAARLWKPSLVGEWQELGAVLAEP